ncbi:H-2 class II histocompatibility antigen, E-S beta chain-like [Sceloporus undulatus]|uniref:H-2 class II histocompatibility antigen, E-S beta chain-like n=1 Tax=Sceloporus undulatus TaxID=8520 RepID=UPI001C4D1144|nr:H-2 class II histocompatibility antigen, E-S beta chain-like [Sceloporus undulatus]
MGPVGSVWAMAGAFFLLLVAGAAAGPPGSFFVYQRRSECHFNGTETESKTLRYFQRFIYNRQEVFYFDSQLGLYVALAPMVQSNVDRFNRDKDLLQSMMADVERFCRHNYGIYEPFALRRRIQPKLKITPMEYDSSSHNMMLICSVDSFFPTKIKITWLRNGKEEDKDMTTNPIDNGDWTYGIQVMLVTKPERGDVYTCQVEHASFASPASVQWEPQSDSARSKMWTGVVGILLGVVFVAAGLSFYLRNKKGQTVTQTTVGLMN